MADGQTPLITDIRPFGAEAMARAGGLVGEGQPVAVPTETVYGLAADARDSAAVARIYAAKGRPDFNPLIVHVPSLAVAEKLGVFGDAERAIAEAFWPGPLTLVVPRSHDCPVASIATAGLATIALVIDDGPTSAGVESTIARVKDGTVEVLRPGPVTVAMLSKISGLPAEGVKGSEIVAPGMLASHYAPGKPVRLAAADFADEEFGIGFGELTGDYNLSPAGDLTEAAARLFDALHAGGASSKAKIAVAGIPVEGLGAAINDRLARAAV